MHQTSPSTAPLWHELEITFTAGLSCQNPYTEVSAWVDFTHEDGTLLRRPMFWDGGKEFRVRFASNREEGRWFWRSFADNRDPGLHGQAGELTAEPGPESDNPFHRHGFWGMSPGRRNLVHADGRARLLCADTAWALPWRATEEQVRIYAADRQAKGFNAALLMTIQPDRKAKGPRSRTEDLGFDVGFEDLPGGTLRQLVPAYFQTFDKLTAILVEHGIAPVYQPVFHGYGWKGRHTAGNELSPGDYARYCRYLVARYGARPAVWLIGGDGPHELPNVVEQLDLSGRTIEQWDAYAHPTGLHYSPHALNRTHQDKAWLDFQWCQTGHNGDHIPERVAHMWHQHPVKAVANGEPTYEGMNHPENGAGWWQGHEAWCNLTAGGTMGLVYGAGSLWQWKLHPGEPDHADWCTAPGAGWREALDFEGARYPGIATRIFDGLPFADLEPNWDFTLGNRGLAIPDRLFVLYLPKGGHATITSTKVPRRYRIYDPTTGEETAAGELGPSGWEALDAGGQGRPRVLVFT
ncbi:MAG: DUF4038 domain-containing protein [Puniceicoccaceae bacterium]|nr:MAG: DUF4038 domain-containing protein [Puniceicoccaceae bacterium]